MFYKHLSLLLRNALIDIPPGCKFAYFFLHKMWVRKQAALESTKYVYFKYLFFFRNDFTGDIIAYGGGNEHELDTVKAGPGTVYYLEGKSPKTVHSLLIAGDTDSAVQEQTHTLIIGDDAEFKYNLITVTGKHIFFFFILFSQS